ncbi:hypothetical protein GQ600_14102 [Phytophthora cactorum]|nr:hypothetical protein GQ600_14102 [Phytophthora cactorum]
MGLYKRPGQRYEPHTPSTELLCCASAYDSNFACCGGCSSLNARTRTMGNFDWIARVHLEHQAQDRSTTSVFGDVPV